MIKKLLPSLIVSLMLLFQSASPAYALTNLGTNSLINSVNREETAASKSAARQDARLADIIKRADQMITVRLATLNKLSTRVQNDSRLSSDEKSSLNGDIQNDISGLTALKAKIDADTDAATAEADAKTIISTYKVFAIFEPKMRMLIILNNLQKPVTTVQGMIPQIQSLISTLQSQGKDTSSLTTLLNDISTRLSAINSIITADITALEAITPQSTDYQTTFTKVRGDISTIMGTDYSKVRSDIGQLRAVFHQVISSSATTPTATGSAVQSNSSNASTSAVPVKPVAVP